MIIFGATAGPVNEIMAVEVVRAGRGRGQGRVQRGAAHILPLLLSRFA